METDGAMASFTRVLGESLSSTVIVEQRSMKKARGRCWVQMSEAEAPLLYLHGGGESETGTEELESRQSRHGFRNSRPGLTGPSSRECQDHRGSFLTSMPAVWFPFCCCGKIF